MRTKHSMTFASGEKVPQLAALAAGAMHETRTSTFELVLSFVLVAIECGARVAK